MNRYALLLAVLAPLAFAADNAEAPPWRDGKTLGDKIVLEDMHVCADAKGHTVVVGADKLYYGADAKKLNRVATEKFLGDGWFFEPRQFCKTNNENFRGMDLRLFSHVDFDKEKNTCSVTCGERKVDLAVLPAEKASPMLLAATLGAPLRTREPHVLLRDQTGMYFYVDRGLAAGEEKNFRLFIGQKGALKLQKMINVVSDSEGEIFSTKAGDLRLVIDRRKPSEWTAGAKRTELRDVPVNENMRLIFTELGVYAGQRLGSPCDDL